MTKVNFEGKTYTLIADADLDGNEMKALAIIDTDEVDEEGWQQCYEIEWDIVNDEAEEMSDMCRWDDESTIFVRKMGEYNKEENRVY